MSLTLHSQVDVRRSLTRLIESRRSLPPTLAEALFNRPETLVGAGRLLRARGARRTVLLDWDGAKYVLKHYVEPSRRHALKQLVLRSRAKATYLTSNRLADSGIRTPRPAAYVENRFGPMRLDSYLLYPYVGGNTLRECMAGLASDSQASRRLWSQLRELWQQLHELKASLADANLGNFILDPRGELWVIDIDKTRFHRLEYFARRHQERGWRQVERSAQKRAAAA